MYKSISLETNKSEWTASFSSNSEYTDDNNQSSLVVSGFVDKEAFKYRDIPRSIKNSTANLVSCPPFGSLGVSYASGQALLDVNFGTLLVFINQQAIIPIPKGKLLAKQNGALVDFNEFTDGVWNNIYVNPEYSESGLADGSIVELVKIDASSNQVLLDAATNYIVAASQLVYAINTFIAQVVCVETNASLNGDMMRGPYLKTSLSINTSEPLEINAINVEYEFSKLDKRLNQNT